MLPSAAHWTGGISRGFAARQPQAVAAVETSVVARTKLVETVAAVAKAAVVVAVVTETETMVAVETALAAVTAGTGWHYPVAPVQRARAPPAKHFKATFIKRCESCEDIGHNKRSCSLGEVVLAFEIMRSDEELAV